MSSSASLLPPNAPLTVAASPSTSTAAVAITPQSIQPSPLPQLQPTPVLAPTTNARSTRALTLPTLPPVASPNRSLSSNNFSMLSSSPSSASNQQHQQYPANRKKTLTHSMSHSPITTAPQSTTQPIRSTSSSRLSASSTLRTAQSFDSSSVATNAHEAASVASAESINTSPIDNTIKVQSEQDIINATKSVDSTPSGDGSPVVSNSTSPVQSAASPVALSAADLQTCLGMLFQISRNNNLSRNTPFTANGLAAGSAAALALIKAATSSQLIDDRLFFHRSLEVDPPSPLPYTQDINQTNSNVPPTPLFKPTIPRGARAAALLKEVMFTLPAAAVKFETDLQACIKKLEVSEWLKRYEHFSVMFDNDVVVFSQFLRRLMRQASSTDAAVRQAPHTKILHQVFNPISSLTQVRQIVRVAEFSSQLLEAYPSPRLLHKVNAASPAKADSDNRMFPMARKEHLLQWQKEFKIEFDNNSVDKAALASAATSYEAAVALISSVMVTLTQKIQSVYTRITSFLQGAPVISQEFMAELVSVQNNFVTLFHVFPLLVKQQDSWAGQLLTAFAALPPAALASIEQKELVVPIASTNKVVSVSDFFIPPHFNNLFTAACAPECESAPEPITVDSGALPDVRSDIERVNNTVSYVPNRSVPSTPSLTAITATPQVSTKRRIHITLKPEAALAIKEAKIQANIKAVLAARPKRKIVVESIITQPTQPQPAPVQEVVATTGLGHSPNTAGLIATAIADLAAYRANSNEIEEQVEEPTTAPLEQVSEVLIGECPEDGDKSFGEVPNEFPIRPLPPPKQKHSYLAWLCCWHLSPAPSLYDDSSFNSSSGYPTSLRDRSGLMVQPGRMRANAYASATRTSENPSSAEAGPRNSNSVHQQYSSGNMGLPMEKQNWHPTEYADTRRYL